MRTRRPGKCMPAAPPRAAAALCGVAVAPCRRMLVAGMALSPRPKLSSEAQGCRRIRAPLRANGVARRHSARRRRSSGGGCGQRRPSWPGAEQPRGGGLSRWLGAAGRRRRGAAGGPKRAGDAALTRVAGARARRPRAPLGRSRRRCRGAAFGVWAVGGRGAASGGGGGGGRAPREESGCKCNRMRPAGHTRRLRAGHMSAGFDSVWLDHIEIVARRRCCRSRAKSLKRVPAAKTTRYRVESRSATGSVFPPLARRKRRDLHTAVLRVSRSPE